jgi:alpha-mannosidase
MSSLAPFPLARRIRWSQKSFLPAALIFSSPAKKPASSGSSNGVSAHLNLEYDDCFFHDGCTLHRIRKTSIVTAFVRSRIWRNKGMVLQAFRDKPKQWDAWNIDADFEKEHWDLDKADEVKLVENGPLRAVIRVKSISRIRPLSKTSPWRRAIQAWTSK